MVTMMAVMATVMDGRAVHHSRDGENGGDTAALDMMAKAVVMVASAAVFGHRFKCGGFKCGGFKCDVEAAVR